MNENKNRVWDALKIYYGIAESLKFSDENCTQTEFDYIHPRFIYNHKPVANGSVLGDRAGNRRGRADNLCYNQTLRVR